MSTHLLDSFVTFNVDYAGLIPEIPLDMDMTGRTDILKVVDFGKKHGNIPWHIAKDNAAVLAINAYSIRITKRLPSEDLLLTAPVHMIASVSFVKDGDFNILGIKIGDIGNNKEISDLAVLYCQSSAMAEQICTILGQCFQLVFSDATVQYFDKKLMEGASSNNIAFFSQQSESVASTNLTFGPLGPSFISGSRTDLARIQPSRPLPKSSTTQSGSSALAADLIQDYMRMLHAMLNPDELKQFAMLLKRWRSSENLPVFEFCQKVLELYGSERRHLLARMRPFIPEKDLGAFVNFLEISGITDNAECSLPSCSPASEKDVMFSTSPQYTNGGSSLDMSTTADVHRLQHSQAASPTWNHGRQNHTIALDDLRANPDGALAKQLRNIDLDQAEDRF